MGGDLRCGVIELFFVWGLHRLNVVVDGVCFVAVGWKIVVIELCFCSAWRFIGVC